MSKRDILREQGSLSRAHNQVAPTPALKRPSISRSGPGIDGDETQRRHQIDMANRSAIFLAALIAYADRHPRWTSARHIRRSVG